MTLLLAEQAYILHGRLVAAWFHAPVENGRRAHLARLIPIAARRLERRVVAFDRSQP